MSAPKRHSKADPCLVCGGDQKSRADDRCHGYAPTKQPTKSDCAYVRCSSAAVPGQVDANGTWLHIVGRTCQCGVNHGGGEAVERVQSMPKSNGKPRPWNVPDSHIQSVHPYHDPQTGEVLWEQVRFNKEVRAHYGGMPTLPRHKANGKLFYGQPAFVREMDSKPLYFERESLESLVRGVELYITEGEKDADTARMIGAAATTNPDGAGALKAAQLERIAKAIGENGGRVVLVADPGTAGFRRVVKAFEWFDGNDLADRVRIILPHGLGADLTDAAEAMGGKAESVDALCSPVTIEAARAELEKCEALDAAKKLGTSADVIELRPGIGDDQDEAGSEWDAPCREERKRLPPLPLDSLPKAIRDLCVEVSAAANCSPDLVATAALGVISTLTAGRVLIEVKKSFQTPVALYMLSLAESGAGKGPAFKGATAPLASVQSELQKAARADVARQRTAYEIAKQTKQRAEKRAAEELDETERTRLIREAQDAAEDFAMLPTPQLPRIYVGDDNSEAALADALSANGQRLGIISPESATLFQGASGRHSAAGMVECRVMLSAWEGEDCSQLRAGRGETPLENPQLSIVGAMQPGVFAKYARNSELTDMGLFNRFIFSQPEFETVYWDDDEIEPDEGVMARWAALVRDLAKILEVGEAEQVLRFDAAGKAAAWDCARAFALMGQPGELLGDGLYSYSRKFTTNFYRIVGLFHCAEMAADGLTGEGLDSHAIGADTVNRAGELAKYFAEHAAGVLVGTVESDESLHARTVLEAIESWAKENPERLHITEEGRAYVSARELQRWVVGSRRKIRDRAELLTACAALVGNFFLKPSERPGPKTRGPRGDWWEVHPELLPRD